MMIQKILIFLFALTTFSIANNITILKSGETKFGVANEHDYSYYKINASKGDEITINLHDMDADGDLYVNIGSIATKDKWKYKSLHSKLSDEKRTFTLTNDNTIYISVYAYKCISTVEHKITVEINKNAPKENNNVQNFPKKPSHTDKFVTYTPVGGIDSSTPVVLFLNGSKRTLDKYEGILNFLSTKGYFVIGAYSDSYNPDYSKNIFTEVINTTKENSALKLNKLAVIGHSLGGGNSFNVMKYFQENGYGKDGSLIFSIEGWFPFGMKKDDFSKINGDVAFLQMNGKDGTKDIDLRMNLTIWNLLKNSEKYFLALPQNNHFYIEDNKENILKKKYLLEIIAKMTDDAFTHSHSGYESIASKYKVSYQDISDLAKKIKSTGGCSGKVGNAISTLNELGNDINYCQPEMY